MAGRRTRMGPRELQDRAYNVRASPDDEESQCPPCRRATVTTIAGSGVLLLGRWRVVLNVMLNQPWAVAVDGGNVYGGGRAANNAHGYSGVSGTTVSVRRTRRATVGSRARRTAARHGARRRADGTARPRWPGLLLYAPGQVGAARPYAVGAGSRCGAERSVVASDGGRR